MKLVIEIYPAGMTGHDIRQMLATVWDTEYSAIIEGGGPLDLMHNGTWRGDIRTETD